MCVVGNRDRPLVQLTFRVPSAAPSVRTVTVAVADDGLQVNTGFTERIRRGGATTVGVTVGVAVPRVGEGLAGLVVTDALGETLGVGVPGAEGGATTVAEGDGEALGEADPDAEGDGEGSTEADGEGEGR